MAQLCIAILVCISMITIPGFGAEGPPNIVLLLADDLGWTGVSCFGSDFHETPHLDRLAEQGMVFTNAYSACTVCSPTRASIMTGKYPARLHLTDFIAGQNRPYEKLTIPNWTKYLKLEELTIAEALRSVGYTTAHVGKWHLEPPRPPAGHQADEYGPKGHGFDITVPKPNGTRGYSLPPEFVRTDGTKGGYLTDYLTDEALEIIDRAAPGPFFLYLAYHTPHTPIQGREDLVRYYRDKLSRRSSLRHRNPEYAAMIHSLDESVGRIVTKLEGLDLTQNTVILFTSDNGGLTQRYGKIDGIADNFPLRRGKGSAYEGGVRVPMIVSWPGMIDSGRRSSEPVMSIDLYPTLIELANSSDDSPTETGVDGLSLVQLLRGGGAGLNREALYWHYPHYHAGGDAPYSAIRSGDWRLIEFHDDTPPALYNLRTDIGEQNNLADTYPEGLQELRDKLHSWRKSVEAQMPSRNSNYDPAKAGQPVNSGSTG